MRKNNLTWITCGGLLEESGVGGLEESARSEGGFGVRDMGFGKSGRLVLWIIVGYEIGAE